MQRDEADSQPTLLAVSGVCGLIQANSRTVSELLFTLTEHKNSGLREIISAGKSENFSVQSISAATEQEDVRQGEHAN